MNIVYALLACEATIVCPRHAIGDDEKDFTCIMKYRGRTLAINSLGDDLADVKKAIGHANDKGCEIFLCALSKDDKSQYRIKDVCNGKYRYATVDKEGYENKDKDKGIEQAANIFFALRMKKNLDYFIDKYDLENTKTNKNQW